MAQRIGGTAGIFRDEHAVVAAARKCREAGFQLFETITPFPLHGMEEAMGIRRSGIPYATFVGGLVGASTALFITIGASAYDWPINVGGKPFNSLPAFIPIVFELTILFGALASISAWGYFCGIPKLDPPVLDPDLTCDVFAIYIPENDAGYETSKVEKMLKDFGAAEVRKVAEY